MHARTVANGMRPSMPKMHSHTISFPPIAFAMVACPYDHNTSNCKLLKRLIAMREDTEHRWTW